MPWPRSSPLLVITWLAASSIICVRRRTGTLWRFSRSVAARHKQLLGHRSIDDPLPVGPSIELVFQRRLAALPATTRTALVVAAADDTGRMDVLAAGLAYLGGEPSWLGTAARTGLVVIDNGRLQFCHPLARSATYHVASSDQRRAAHYALSTVDVPGVDDATRAWHRAAAAIAPDEKVAQELELAAEAAMRRGAPSAAPVRFSARQALLRLRPRRPARLLRAVEGWWLGNDRDAAASAADEALAIADDPVVRADVVMFRGLAETWGGNAPGGANDDRGGRGRRRRRCRPALTC